MLRASIEETGTDYQLDGVIGNGDGGIPHGELLTWFAEAVVKGDDAGLTAARGRLMDSLGWEALVDASGIVATFNAIDRVADATGTPIEDERIELTSAIRSQLGIDQFPSVVSP